jgi:hypothetical protein
VGVVGEPLVDPLVSSVTLGRTHGAQIIVELLRVDEE